MSFLAREMIVISVNVTSIVHRDKWTGSVGSTGIDKQPVARRVKLADCAVEGDVVADRKNHGGYDQAVYAYAREDSDWWESELGIAIGHGRFGENLTTQGVDVTGAVIGERWSIGTAVLEVSQPRIPCRVFAGFWDRPSLIKDFTNAARPGAYLRIIQDGNIGGGDDIIISSRPSHGITISDLFAAKRGERSRMSEILLVPELSDSYRDWATNIKTSHSQS
jgi:MOSC domain-containing protein YiiM